MTLYQHQVEGAAWLAERGRGYLAHQPGLGKTRTLLRAAMDAGVERPLIVCPAIVRSHWHREASAMGWPERSGFQLPYVSSYDEITRGGDKMMAHFIRDEKIDSLILDEAHYLKHATSQRTQQILGRDGYARRLDTVWLASGTPIPRNPAEIWTVLASLFPDVASKYGLRTYRDFVDRYCVVRVAFVRGALREKVVGVKAENVPELRALLSEIMQVRTLDDVGLDVPALDWQLTRLDGAAIDTYEDGLLVRHALDLGTALADIADDPHVARMRRRLGELKAPLAVEMLKSQLEDSAGKVAVFAHHRSVLNTLREGLRDFGVAYVDGDTSPIARDNQIRDFAFEHDAGIRVFLGQNQACATGMDGLQYATSRAVLVEPDWAADVNYQLGKRVARIGSEAGHAIVQMIALAGTLDEAIVAQNKRETEMVEQALPAGSLE